MQTRRLGYSDLNLTTVGLGTWAMGGGGWQWAWGSQEDDESIAAIRRGLDLGINWVDTAAGYGLGHSEEVLAKALEGRRQEVIVATKCGMVWDENDPDRYDKPLRFCLERDSVRRECEASLRRLNTDVIDLYQIHWPNDEEHLEEGWSAIADLIKEGKVRYAGLSNTNIEQMGRLQAIAPIASLQPPYSMVRRDIEAEILPFCAAHNIGVVVYSPMQAGLLTGKVTREWVASLPDDDWRKTKSSHFQEPQLSANIALVDGLREIATRSGRSVAELAIAWVLRRPEVTSAIVGARKPSQINETAAGGDWPLNAEEIAEIEVLLNRRQAATA
ncbi:MAG: aldo/keto reductase [Anaerolineae bacterium]|nr:aldo/keto reductase [Anaerolineae bacterium]